MTFPGPKIHRPSRRHLSRGDYPVAIGVTASVTASGSTATITFSRPVIVAGLIPLAIPGVSLVAQSQVSNTVWTQLFSAPLNTLAWSLPPAPMNVTTPQGGVSAGATGTFGSGPPPGSLITSVIYGPSPSYTVTFSTTIATFNSGVRDVALAFWNPSLADWNVGEIDSSPASNQLIIGSVPAESGNTIFGLLAPPTQFSLALAPVIPQVVTIT